MFTGLKVTPIAQDELRLLLQNNSLDTPRGLRLSVERGGCAGFQYIMKVSQRHEGDLQAGADDAPVFLASDSLTWLSDATLDFEESLNDRGFRVISPKATRHCGCGTSFEPAEDNSNTPPLD